MMTKPTQLPRVAFLTKHKIKKIKREVDNNNINDEVQYNEIEEEEEQEDVPYFYIDKNVSFNLK